MISRPVPIRAEASPRRRPAVVPSLDSVTDVATLPQRSPAALTPETSNPGFELASAAYARLAAGDRRSAVAGFTAALDAAPDDLNAIAWRRQRDALLRRWSGEAYVLVRGAGDPGLGFAPVLGGGQSGARLAWSLDPLARAPLAITVRASVANDLYHGDAATLQTAFGLRWRVLPGLSLNAERLIAVGSAARDSWMLRAEGGIERAAGPVLLDAYAEAGVVGARRHDLFASLQARATTRVGLGSGVTARPGIGLWSAVQHGAATVERVDVGPTLALQARPMNLTLAVDYRRRVFGNAAPASGAVLTVSAGF